MRVFATAAFSFSAAILVSQYIVPDYLQPYCAAALLIIGIAAAFFRFSRKKRVLIILFSLAVGFAFNFGYTSIALAPAYELDGGRHTVTAEVCDYPEKRTYGERVSVKIFTDTVSVNANAYTYGSFPEGIEPGDRITFTADFSLSNEIYGSETDYFFSKGVYLSALGAENITIAEKSRSQKYFYIDISRKIKAKIREIFPDDTVAFALAVLTGDKTELNDESDTVYAMQRSGIYHIATVSGMHVSMLTAFITLLLGKRRRSALLTVPMLALFAAVSGFTPSVMRAAIMQLFIISAPIFKREDDRLTSLSAAMLIILALNPFAVKSVGFQLSFASTLGIVLFSDRIYAFLSERLVPRHKSAKRILFTLFGSIATSLGALILTAPLSAAYFGYISLASPVTNLLIVWALGPAFMLSCTAAGIGFLYVPAAKALAFVASIFVKYIVFIAKLLSESFLSAIYIDNIFIIVWLAFVYASLVVFAYMRAKPRKLILPASIAVISLSAILIISSVLYDSAQGYSLTVLDIGQGQCIVITSGEYTAVIDCGSTTRTDAGAVAAQYIYGMGRDTVDLLMLTHYHSDHANGVKELMGRLKVDTVAVPLPENEESDLDEEIINLALSAGTELVFVTENMTAELGGMTIEMYAPMGTSSENERGICMLISEGEFDTLITGDIDSKLEKMLIGANDLPDIECLVVGHHGSRYSTCEELLEAVTPEIGVISVGYNTYGHPANECLERLRMADVAVYRTDQLGNIIIKSRGSILYDD